MGLHRSLDTGGEVAGTQAELWEGVSWEGNNDILAHLRLCGCRKGSWYGIPMKMIYWEVPLGNPCRKVGEAVKGGRSTESTVGNWDTWNKIPCCPPRIPAHFSPPLQDAWEILAQVLAAGPQGSSGEPDPGWWDWAHESHRNKWWGYVSVPVFSHVSCTIGSLDQR